MLSQLNISLIQLNESITEYVGWTDQDCLKLLVQSCVIKNSIKVPDVVRVRRENLSQLPTQNMWKVKRSVSMAGQAFTFIDWWYFIVQQDAHNSYSIGCYQHELSPYHQILVLTNPLFTAGSWGQTTPTLWATSTAASSSRWSRKLGASLARGTATRRTG